MFENRLERKIDNLERTVNSLIGEMSNFLRRLETNHSELNRRMRGLEHSVSPYSTTEARTAPYQTEADQLHRRSQWIMQERVDNLQDGWTRHHIWPEGPLRPEENQREREEWDD